MLLVTNILVEFNPMLFKKSLVLLRLCDYLRLHVFNQRLDVLEHVLYTLYLVPLFVMAVETLGAEANSLSFTNVLNVTFWVHLTRHLF